MQNYFIALKLQRQTDTFAPNVSQPAVKVDYSRWGMVWGLLSVVV